MLATATGAVISSDRRTTMNATAADRESGTLTLDDLIDLHYLLEEDRLFLELLALAGPVTAPGRPGRPSAGR
jgi:hypothetical protein